MLTTKHWNLHGTKWGTDRQTGLTNSRPTLLYLFQKFSRAEYSCRIWNKIRKRGYLRHGWSHSELSQPPAETSYTNSIYSPCQEFQTLEVVNDYQMVGDPLFFPRSLPRSFRLLIFTICWTTWEVKNISPFLLSCGRNFHFNVDEQG